MKSDKVIPHGGPKTLIQWILSFVVFFLRGHDAGCPQLELV